MAVTISKQLKTFPMISRNMSKQHSELSPQISSTSANAPTHLTWFYVPLSCNYLHVITYFLAWKKGTWQPRVWNYWNPWCSWLYPWFFYDHIYLEKNMQVQALFWNRLYTSYILYCVGVYKIRMNRWNNIWPHGWIITKFTVLGRYLSRPYS